MNVLFFFIEKREYKLVWKKLIKLEYKFGVWIETNFEESDVFLHKSWNILGKTVTNYIIEM